MLVAAIVIGILLCFALVLLVGPPYLPTLSPQMHEALDMLNLKPGQTMIELGCGDGKVLIAAAQRGWRVVGIELNPLLVLVCKLRTWRYRQLVTVRWGNYWNIDLWPSAEGIFGFVLPRYMSKLDKTIITWRERLLSDVNSKKLGQNLGRNKVKLASFAFKIPHKRIVRQTKGVFLYEY